MRASLDILDAGGPEALTVQAVVERAGSSVGSFYARFEGKDELLAYLGERVWREAAGRWDERLASIEPGGMALADVAEGAVRLLGEAARLRATHLRKLRSASGTGDGAPSSAYAAFQAHVLEGIEGLLLAHRDEIGHPDPEIAVRLGLRAVLGVLDEGEVGEPAAPVPVERRMEEAATLLVGYLVHGRRDRGAGGKVDFFDVWG